MSHLTDDTKAILLLCGVFCQGQAVKPLSVKEYAGLVRWLMALNLRPKDLFQKEILSEAALGTDIPKPRLEKLFSRGVQLGFSVEEWQRNGVWIVSRSDEDYPLRLKKHLKDKAPPLLFGVGNKSLLKGGGLAVVGSRNVDQKGEHFTHNVAELCAQNKLPVVSGGARGVDQISMTGALEAGGVTIGILADSLLKKSLERHSRKAISEGRLLLISPFHPKAGFTIGTAMGRNKLIYAMADYALVVSADYKRGGTWSGAVEELRRPFARPVFVRIEENTPQGNEKLLPLGAIPWLKKIDIKNLKNQIQESIQKYVKVSAVGPRLFDLDPKQEVATAEEVRDEDSTYQALPMDTSNGPKTIFKAILPLLLENLAEPKTPEELAEALDVNKTQLKAWLKTATQQSHVIKLTQPIRYQRKNTS